MSDRLLELNAFVRAAETGSFSRVAREFGVSQPSVSRMVANLEARLGVKLLLRTTRQVSTTDAGAALLERARHVLGELDDAMDAARGVDSLGGALRVAMPGAFGTREGFRVRRPPAGNGFAFCGRRASLPRSERPSPDVGRPLRARLHRRPGLLGSKRLELQAFGSRDVAHRRRSSEGGLRRRRDRLR